MSLPPVFSSALKFPRYISGMILFMSSTLKRLALLILTVSSLTFVVGWISDWHTFMQNRNKEAAAFESRTIYLGLRNQALRTKREDIGLAAASKPTEPWGVVMDWNIDDNTATVVAISDGTASVYLSTGGGSIGGGQFQQSIRKAAQNMVSVAAEFQPQMIRATDVYPLPQRGKVVFYVLTDAGVFTASASEAEVVSHKHPLSKLGDAGQEVITQYRLTHKL